MSSATRTTNPRRLRVLQIDSSGRYEDSASRTLTADLVEALAARYPDVDITRRDLADGLPFVDAGWIDANFTAPEERSPEHREKLAVSDRLVSELEGADVIVIGTPLYNFGIPAVLKAWIDMIARARRTFRYTEDGPVGLLHGKKAYLVVATGGVAVGGKADFATPYLRHALNFVGITDIDVIGADRINSRGDDALESARLQIAELVHTTPLLTSSAA
jgi:FMN-dependent NADH-azoreductase